MESSADTDGSRSNSSIAATLMSHPLFTSSDEDESFQLYTQRSDLIRSMTEAAVGSRDIARLRALLPFIKKYVLPLSCTSESNVSGHIQGLACQATTADEDDILKILLENGADLHALWRGRTLLQVAISNSSVKCIRTLINMEPTPTTLKQTFALKDAALKMAAARSSAETIHCLLDLGASLDGLDRKVQHTALHVACTSASTESVIALYERGAEFNTINSYGNTPLSKLLQTIDGMPDSDPNKCLRLNLAKKLIALGFMLPVRRQSVIRLCPSTDDSDGKDGNRDGTTRDVRKECVSTKGTDPLRTGSCLLSCASAVHSEDYPQSCDSKTDSRLGTGVISQFPGSKSFIVSKQEPFSLEEEERIALRNHPSPSLKQRVRRRYWELRRDLRPSLSLQEVCRLAIIRCIMLTSSPLAPAVAQLGLPRILRRFIINRDVTA